MLHVKPTKMSLKLNMKPNHHHHIINNSTTITTTTTHEYFHHLKEHMFEKRLTPSDVGKLNRLVIPKQYAEKYLPGVSSGSLVLTLVDESSKQWKFRYSYWNSSQSYVFTKGWSRFVKDKKLEAGDVVFFQRQVVDSGSVMFLGWRRRVNDGWISSEKPEMMKYKTVRLFGVNLECRTLEAQEDSVNEMKPPTPDHACFATNMQNNHEAMGQLQNYFHYRSLQKTFGKQKKGFCLDDPFCYFGERGRGGYFGDGAMEEAYVERECCSQRVRKGYCWDFPPENSF